MARYVVLRILGGFVTLLLLSVLVFASTEVLPGNAAQSILGRESTPERVALLKERLGLDEPAPNRYFAWLKGAIQLDFGESLVQGTGLAGTGAVEGTPVSELVGPRLRKSAVLGLVTLLILIPLSLFLGVVTGLKRGSVGDGVTQVGLLVLISLPEFVLGAILVLLFGVVWAVLPAVSLGSSPAELVLPVATLIGVCIAFTSRFIRAGVSDVATRDFVAMARLKGLPEKRVVRKHILPNALGPALQSFALVTAWLAGGIIVVEYLFSYPGIGQGIVAAISARDVPTIQAYTLLIACIYVMATLIADLLTISFNPRLRASYAR
jgi:peptide/nickel transport system permease protein